MAVSSTVSMALTAFAADVTAAAPLNSATSILIAALQAEGAALLAKIDLELTNDDPPLDAVDPTGFPGEMVPTLTGLAQSSEDQAALCDMRGHVGRAIFNLSQVNA